MQQEPGTSGIRCMDRHTAFDTHKIIGTMRDALLYADAIIAMADRMV